MQIRLRTLTLTKRYPLTISRGTSAASENLILAVEHDGVTGLGEMAPVNIGDGPEDAEAARHCIERWIPALEDVAPWEMQRVERALDKIGGGRAARCALDMALYDWLGKRASMPVYRLIGGDLDQIAPTSITVGINAPDVVRERIPELFSRLAPKALKIKLGCPDGCDADRAMFEVVRELTPRGVSLRVDANGGWDVDTAVSMIEWLAERGVEYVEQPLPLDRERDMYQVYACSRLPIFADESCRVASDVPRLADRVHGINLKLMKAGGIREGLRVIQTARALGLQVMMGCMSESSLAIAASVALSPFADHLDLDSHLNLLPDPFEGLAWRDGRVLPSDSPGLGIAERPT